MTTLLELVTRSRGAVVVDGRWFSVSDLMARAERVAGGLRQRGLGPNEGVLLVDDGTGADLLSGLLGTWWRGARPVVLAGTAGPAEMARVRAQSGAQLVVGAAARPGEELTSTYAELRDCDARPPGPECRPNHFALDIVTSGTTGTPKCVTFTHAALHRNVMSFADRLDLGRDDVLYTPLPLSIAGVVGMVLLPGLAAGATVHLSRLTGPNLALAPRHLREHQPTLLYGVPYMFEFMARQRELAGCTRLRWAVCSSAPLPETTFDRVWRHFGVPPRSSYCLAEAGTVTLNTSDDPEVLRTTVGEPLDGTSVILEPLDTELDESGTSGRIVVGGASPAAGYRSGRRLVPFPDGVVRTQDRGSFLGPNLAVLGRLDDVIQVAGHNVDLAHVRRVLLECPGLGEFAVVVDQHRHLGAVPVLVAEAGSLTATSEQVIEYCRRSLREVEVPREVRTVVKLVRTATGKVRADQGVR